MALVTTAVLLCGCGGSRRESTSKQSIRAATTSSRGPEAHTGELLSVPAVGRIYGRCDPGDGRWTIKFINDAPATDTVTYRIGTGRSHMMVVDPGQDLVWKLLPSHYTSHEPADTVSHFPGITPPSEAAG